MMSLFKKTYTSLKTSTLEYSEQIRDAAAPLIDDVSSFAENTKDTAVSLGKGHGMSVVKEASGAVVGVSTPIATISVLGVNGLSAAGMTSGLAVAGLGGGMVVGLGAVAVIGAAGYVGTKAAIDYVGDKYAK